MTYLGLMILLYTINTCILANFFVWVNITDEELAARYV